MSRLRWSTLLLSPTILIHFTIKMVCRSSSVLVIPIMQVEFSIQHPVSQTIEENILIIRQELSSQKNIHNGNINYVIDFEILPSQINMMRIKFHKYQNLSGIQQGIDSMSTAKQIVIKEQYVNTNFKIATTIMNFTSLLIDSLTFKFILP